MSTKKEIRNVSGTELRALSNFEISGIAAAYNVKSSNLGGFKERIAPGAFANAFKSGADVRILFNHNPDLVLGRTKSGTASLSDSPAGLCFSCKLDAGNSQHQAVYHSIKRGDIDQCSFGFTVNTGGDDFSDDGDVDESGRSLKLRTLRSVELLDCSPVTYPAYPDGTSVAARSGAVALVRQATFDYIVRSTSHMTDAQRLARAARLGTLIDADTQRQIAEAAEAAKSINVLRERMNGAAGRTCG